jgi:hypothetical protein
MREGPRLRISEDHPAYAPLQYVLLFPYGENGWHSDLYENRPLNLLFPNGCLSHNSPRFEFILALMNIQLFFTVVDYFKTCCGHVGCSRTAET